MESLCQRYLGKLTLKWRFVTQTGFIGTSVKSWTQLTVLVTDVLEGQHSSLNSREVETDQAKQPQSFLSVRGREDGKMKTAVLRVTFFPFPFFWSSCLKEHFAPLEYEPLWRPLSAFTRSRGHRDGDKPLRKSAGQRLPNIGIVQVDKRSCAERLHMSCRPSRW